MDPNYLNTGINHDMPSKINNQNNKTSNEGKLENTTELKGREYSLKPPRNFIDLKVVFIKTIVNNAIKSLNSFTEKDLSDDMKNKLILFIKNPKDFLIKKILNFSNKSFDVSGQFKSQIDKIQQSSYLFSRNIMDVILGKNISSQQEEVNNNVKVNDAEKMNDPNEVIFKMTIDDVSETVEHLKTDLSPLAESNLEQCYGMIEELKILLKELEELSVPENSPHFHELTGLRDVILGGIEYYEKKKIELEEANISKNANISIIDTPTFDTRRDQFIAKLKEEGIIKQDETLPGNEKDCKKLYIKLMLKLHPDKNHDAGDTEKFNALKEAWSIFMSS